MPLTRDEQFKKKNKRERSWANIYQIYKANKRKAEIGNISKQNSE